MDLFGRTDSRGKLEAKYSRERIERIVPVDRIRHFWSGVYPNPSWLTLNAIDFIFIRVIESNTSKSVAHIFDVECEFAHSDIRVVLCFPCNQGISTANASELKWFPLCGKRQKRAQMIERKNTILSLICHSLAFTASDRGEGGARGVGGHKTINRSVSHIQYFPATTVCTTNVCFAHICGSGFGYRALCGAYDAFRHKQK